jgi:hypothetical protein
MPKEKKSCCVKQQSLKSIATEPERQDHTFKATQLIWLLLDMLGIIALRIGLKLIRANLAARSLR